MITSVSTQRKILLVEDNLLSQTIALQQLEKLGYRGDVAKNGIEAVRAAKDGAYDLILMDCLMPDMDGYRASAEIRRWETGRHHTPIVALTACAESGDREKCLASGMDDYLGKPFRSVDLRVILQRWLSETMPIDMTLLRDVTGDSWEGMRYLTDIYVQNSRKSFGKIAAALEAQDAKALQMAAHGCAGSSASFGAAPLSERLHELEKMGQQATLAAAPLKLEECRKEFERVVSCLADLFSHKKAA